MEKGAEGERKGRKMTEIKDRSYPQSQCNMFEEDKYMIPSVQDVAQTLRKSFHKILLEFYNHK